MSDEEESTRREQEDTEHKSSSSDDDDDSSSSSSGSSSSSSSSDSESEGEENENADKHKALASPAPGNGGYDGQLHPSMSSARKLSSDGQSTSHNFSKSALAQATAAEMHINPNRAAARFREQNSTQTMGLMALGTKKRDRRTIEEIQRDLQRKRGKKPLPGGASGNATLAARSSPPPRGSPIRSPESGGSTVSDPAAVMSQQLGYGGMGGVNGRNIIRKPVSARDRLEIKLKGRRSNASAPAPAAKGRKPAAGGATATAGMGAGGAGMVTNISAGKIIKAPVGGSMSDHDSVSGDTRAEPAPGIPSRSSVSGSAGLLTSSTLTSSATARMEPKIETKVVEVQPDGRIVRALLRGMLRYGDLTDVHMFPGAPTFADEYKQPNFVERSNLQGSTKMTVGRLLGIATEIAERAQTAVENKQDSMKYCDVEVKPSQVIERLYENLKLRVAVQRALRDTNCPKNGTNSAYVLVAKQCDLPMLGIPRDFPAWTWAEKEHDWNSRKDAALLLGIYVHGFGGWEDILNDDLLHFQQQRALKGERMKKRAENLLKRLPSPDNSGEPKFVNAANVLALGPQNSNQSIGAHFSAILHNSNGAGKGGGPVIVSASSGAGGALGVGSGRMQRAAERAAARQQVGVGSSSAVPEDSIRRMHSQHSSNGSHSGGSDGGGSNCRYRKSSAASSPNDNGEPEDGEIDMERDRPAIKSHSSSRATSPMRRPSSSSGKPRRSNSSASSKRSASVEREDANGEVSNKRRKGGDESSHRPSSVMASQTHASSSSNRRRLLSDDESYDKWKPNKKLKDIRQVLKKMKIMTEWSTNQKDSVVVEKVYKYVTTIGEAIDKIVRKAEPDASASNGSSSSSSKNERPVNAHEWDELCTCLWTYAAGYTPFSSQTFERLYDDICADGDVLRAGRRRTPSSSS